jgi:hypothetical protein
MRLTWRDGVTTLLLVAVGLVYYSFVTGSELAVINDTRGALLVIGATALGMCIVGGGAGITGRNTYTILMSVLGVAAFALVVIGLITALEWTVTWLAIDVAAMWGMALVYRLFLAPTHRTGMTHA